MIKKIQILLAALAMGFYVQAQENNFSPYSSVGVGDLHHNALGTGMAMGGTGIALRHLNEVNLLNPASYNAQDTMSFVFSAGLTYNNTLYQAVNEDVLRNNFNLNHLAIKFPFTKWWYSSVGLMPFSSVGYHYQTQKVLLPEENLYGRRFHDGEGGLSQIYWGHGIRIGNFLSLGVNASYVFGVIERSNTTSLDYINGDTITPYIQATDVEFEEFIETNGFNFSFGAQLMHTFNDAHRFILGGVFEPSTVLNSKPRTSAIYQNPAPFFYLVDTIYTFPNQTNMELPLRYGLGLSYDFKEKLLITAEYETRKWSEYRYKSITSSDLKDLVSYRGGIEFTPNRHTLRRRSVSSYLDRVSYRAGVYYHNTQLNLESEDIIDKGFTLGLGLPLGNSKTTFNLGYLRGVRGTTDKGLVQENYNRFVVGFTLYDIWFYRSKFD